MGLLTIPMALLCLGGVTAGLVLVPLQAWSVLSSGVAAFTICSVLAHPLERMVIAVDDIAAVSLERGRPTAAYVAAVVSGALPVATIFAAEIVSLHVVLIHTGTAPRVLCWLWGYVAATGSWTLFAERVSRFRRTLVGIRAYAGHIALWLFSVLTLWGDVPVAAAVAAMLVPAMLPFTVGLLLALADRQAIADVRV